MNELIADQLRDAYIARIRLIKPYFTGSPTLDKAVIKAADICESIGADIEAFVLAQDKFKTTPEFYPTLLHSKYAVSNYEKYRSSCVTEDSVVLDVQKKYLRVGLENGRKIMNMLMDDQLGFYAWFRILVTKEPNPDLIAKYYQKAQNEVTPKLKSFLVKCGFDLTRINNPDKYL